MDNYFTPSHTQEFQLEIKRSRFISTVVHVTSRDAAKAALASIRSGYPDANHHCWGLITGAPNDVHGADQSDDGEPKDTAGKPILNVLQHSGLGHVLLVVTRYFGGIKLGAGGLVRAYSQSASTAIKATELEEYWVRDNVTIELPYNVLGKVEYWLLSQTIDVVDKRFDTQVQLVLGMPRSQVSVLIDHLLAMGSGEITVVARPS